MGYPACEEESGGGRREIGGRTGLAEEVARVIERHDDHDDAAKKVDRFEAGAFYRHGFGEGGHVVRSVPRQTLTLFLRETNVRTAGWR